MVGGISNGEFFSVAQLSYFSTRNPLLTFNMLIIKQVLQNFDSYLSANFSLFFKACME